MAKHRNRKTVKAVKKAGLMGTVALSATALTMGLTAPAAGAAAIGSSSQQEVALSALEDFLTGGITAEDLAAIGPGALLQLLGLNLPNIEDLIPSEGLPGFKLITTGPPFGALAFLGLNPTWVRADSNAIADAINSTEYVPLDLGINIPGAFILLPLRQALSQSPFNLSDTSPFGGLRLSRAALALCGLDGQACGVPPGGFPLGIPNLRLPTVVGFGIGSLAAGNAWDGVVADLPNQPGGTGEDALPGRSLTILNLILLRNPGRPDGGIAARFSPLLEIIGIDGVTEDEDVATDGGAVLVPNKVDATVEYDPLSDFAAWPNPFTLANNGAAFLFPTYILRGSETPLPGMLTQIFGALLPGVATNIGAGVLEGLPTNFVIRPDGGTLNVPCAGSGVLCGNFSPLRAFTVQLPDGGISINVREAVAAGFGDIIEQELGIEIPDGYEAFNNYLTFRQNALPLLEPFRYPADFANLFTGGAFGFTNPFADAIEPALKILVNLGYTNVDQANGYERDFSDNFGGTLAPFFTFPENVDWGQVPQDVFEALIQGTQDAFFSGGIPGVHPGANIANPLAMILSLLGLGGGGLPGLGGIPDLGGLLDGIPGLGDFLGSGLGLPADTVTTLAAPTAPGPGAPGSPTAPADSNDPLTRLGAVLANTLFEAFDRQAPVSPTASTGPVDSAADVIEGLGASGLRLLATAVLGPTRLAALAEGGPEALADLIENSVDAPLWIADPLLYGLRDAAPEGLQDGITDFRDNLWRLTEQINDALLGALDDLPGAPADTQVTAGNAKQQSPQVQDTLRAAGTLPQEVPSSGGRQITVDVPQADPVVTPKDDEEEVVVDKETSKTTQNPNRIAGQVSKGIERVGERVHDAITDTVKALTPKKPAPAATSSTTDTEE